MTFLFGFIVGFVMAVLCLAIWGALWVSSEAKRAEVLELRRVK